MCMTVVCYVARLQANLIFYKTLLFNNLFGVLFHKGMDMLIYVWPNLLKRMKNFNIIFFLLGKSMLQI
jgi:hypothetical protein